MAKQNKNKGFLSDVYSAFRSQPMWLQIVEVILLIFILYKAITSISRFIKNKKSERDAKNEIAQLEAKGEKPSLNDFNYKDLADKLQKLINNASSISVIPVTELLDNLQNDMDMYKLIDAYGTRDYSWYGFTYNYALPEAMNEAFKGYNLTIINQFLASKGLTYRF